MMMVVADLAIEPTPAIHQPQTHAALNRARWVRDIAVWGGLIALVLGAWLLWTGSAAGRSLDADGIRVQATVTAVASQRVNGGGNERGQVTFTYEVNGQPHTATNMVGGDILSFHEGDVVAVVVPPDDEDGARLASQMNAVGWEVPGLLLVGLGIVAGTWGVVRARALRRMVRSLASSPWLAVHSAFDQDGSGGTRTLHIIALTREPGDDPQLVLGRGLRRPGMDIVPLAWIVGWGARQMVLSPPGGGRLLEVRPVARRTPQQATRGTQR